MESNLLSPSWYRVAPLRPRMRDHARLHRHRYRGQIWYVVQDPASGRCHRITESAHALLMLANGVRTTQEIWDAACERFGDDAPTQDETIQLLGALHAADLLHCDIPPDMIELLQRRERRENSAWWQRHASPLAQRFSLLDPDRFLDSAAPLVRHLFTRAGAALWCATVGAALIAAALHWEELRAGAARDVLEPDNLLWMLLVYPFVKALHELGHAFATKVFGGEVHDVGIMLLVLFPVPYVDASAASVLADERKRMLVGAAGIAVELFLAAVALFVWLAVEPGSVRSLALAVMSVGGLSTLFFNGNPLLRFDGYYVLADALEIPNLDSRSKQYVGYLVQRHLLGLADVRDPSTDRGEARWLVVYAVAASVYRFAVLFGIALFLAGRFFVLGVVLATLGVVVQVLVPLVRAANFTLRSPRLAERRTRALGAALGVATGVLLLLVLLPLPSRTRAQGVVWPPEGAEVRAGSDGFVVRLEADPDATVAVGDPLVSLRDPALEAEVRSLEARRREVTSRLYAELAADPTRTPILREELHTAETELARARERIGLETVRSAAQGNFVVPAGWNLVGRYVRRGELLGYVIGPVVSTVRVAVPQSDIARVREATRRVEVRLSRNVERALPATILRIVPGAADGVPSPALGSAGGGPFAIDPTDEKRMRTQDPVFVLDLALPEEAGVREIGGRVHVRFDHPAEPLAVQAWRTLRGVFLRRLGV